MVEVLEKSEAPPELYFDTFEEWLAWSAHQEERTELVDGKVVFVHRNARGEYVGVKVIHQLLIKFLVIMIDTWIARNSAGGLVLFAPISMRTEQRRRYGREPDILYIAPEKLERVRDTYIDGPADLVIEIVSPESVDRDRDDKFFEYQAAGIREYWMIDPETRGAMFFRLDERGRYYRVEPENGIFVSEVISGLSLRPEWFWQASLPTMADVERLWNESNS